MDEQTRELCRRMGFHYALAAAEREQALTPQEQDAMPTFRLWQQLGLRHVTLQDAVDEMQRQKDGER